MTKRVLHLASTLGPSAAGQGVLRMISRLPIENVDSLVINLAKQNAEIDQHLLPNQSVIQHRIRYAFDLKRLRDIQIMYRHFQPDIVHTWGRHAFYLAQFLKPKKLIVSYVDRAIDPITKWLIRRANRITFTGPAERLRYVQFGIREKQLYELPFAVKTKNQVNFDIRNELGLPTGCQLIVAAGGFDEIAGMKYAVWAFDIVRQLHPNLRLILLGDGPKRSQVEAFSKKLSQRDSRVHFLGYRVDVINILRSADVAWLTHAVGGMTFAFEALSCGIPVIAFRTEDTQCLPIGRTQSVQKNDPVALANATNDWLNQKKSYEAKAFPMDRLVSSLVSLYDD